jgi:RNA polymerase sigma-70 factor (sigma-E family)
MSTTGTGAADTAAVVQRGAAIPFLEPSTERLERLAGWFEAEYPALLRFANYVCGNPTTAQDLVQDAFVRLYRSANRIDDRSVGAYARTTIVNLSRSAFRRRSREAFARVEDAVGGAVAAHDPTARDEIWRALATLSPRQRAVIALRFYEDMTEPDVAEALHMSLGSVKKHSARAMRTLRDTLGRDR